MTSVRPCRGTWQSGGCGGHAAPRLGPAPDIARASPAFCWASPAGPAEPGYLAQPTWWSWASAAAPPGWATLSAPPGSQRARGKPQSGPVSTLGIFSLFYVLIKQSPRSKKGGTKASGGLTLARGIGPQDIKLLNKLGLDEKEAMLVRFLGPAGEPEVRLLDLAELHLQDSKDGKSLDAQCITAAFKRHLDLFDDRRGKWLTRWLLEVLCQFFFATCSPRSSACFLSSLRTSICGPMSSSARRHYLCLRPMRCSSTYSSRRRRRRSNTA